MIGTPTRAVVMHGPWPARCASTLHLRRQATLTCQEEPEHPLPHRQEVEGHVVTWEPAGDR